jgi:hypothetical protein
VDVSKGLWAWKGGLDGRSWADLEPLATPIPGRVVYSSYQPKDLVLAMEQWQDERKQLVKDIGLGGTLEIGKIKKSNRDYNAWLLKRVDTKNSVLRIGERETVQIAESDFGAPLGIRSGGAKQIERSEEKPSVFQIMTV